MVTATKTAVRKVGDEQRTLIIDQPETVGDKLNAEVLSDTKVQLNHEFALSYLNNAQFAGEREIQDSHIQEIYDLMKQRTFNPQLVTIATAEFKGTTYRINGQHTTWATLWMPPETAYDVRYVHYRVKSMEQLRLLYSTFDRILSRSDSHLLKIQLVETPEMEGIPPSMIQRMAPGIKLWLFEKQHERARCNPQNLSALIRHKHSITFQRVAKFLVNNHNKFAELRRQAVVAALLATFDAAPTKATEFWESVATGINLPSRTDPRFKLRDTLLKTAIVQRGVGKGRRNVSTEELYRICITLWNHWRDGNEVQAAPRTTSRRTKPK